MRGVLKSIYCVWGLYQGSAIIRQSYCIDVNPAYAVVLGPAPVFDPTEKRILFTALSLDIRQLHLVCLCRTEYLIARKSFRLGPGRADEQLVHTCNVCTS